MDDLFFAHEQVRPVQEELIKTIQQAITNKKHVLVHAPTGLGKTAAVLAPTIALALKKNLTIFFLTSRHTQHQIILETLRKIKQKYKLTLESACIIGKKWMCAQPNTETLPSHDFAEFCKSLRENEQCEFYTNTRTKNNGKTPEAQLALKELKVISPIDATQISENAKTQKLCPYEMSLLMAQTAHVIITDYYYLFHPSIRESFLLKINKKLENSIVIVDEGHNLPARARELMTTHLTTWMIRRAIKEAKKFHLESILSFLVELQEVLLNLADPIKNEGERLIKREDFMERIQKFSDYEQLIDDLDALADEVRKKQRVSSLGSIATFLEGWQGADEGFSRILTRAKEGPIITLSHRCLDPSVVTKEVFDASYASIVMSGTLTPTEMYKDLLGFTEATTAEFESPFPEENRLAMVIPKTTTKYSMRSEQQFEAIAKYCAEIANEVPGNVAIFFPSYALRDSVAKYFSELCDKTQFLEESRLTKQEKAELLEKFKSYQKAGAVLLGASSGSFGEGIDLPGDLLKAVIIVGLPLDKPDLETQQLIAYFDQKYKKGWDYGYILPAITKTMQNAGRCIRTETDRGVIVFLDERYAWPQYLKCFPSEWRLTITIQPKEKIRNFFREV